MSVFKKILMWIGIFLGSGICFLAVIYLTASVMTSGLKKPIQNQLAAIRSEDVAGAYAFTSTTFQASTSFEAFKKFINDYSALRNNESISFDERSVNNGVGIVFATLISRSKAKTPVLYRLIKENDKWKIESMVLNPTDETIVSMTAMKLSPTTSKTTTTTATKSTPPVKAPIPDTSTQKTPVNAQPITHVYQNPQYRFSIGYPDNWEYFQPSSSMVVFAIPNADGASKMSLSLQTLATYARRSVQTFVDQLSIALNQKTNNARLLEDAIIPTLEGKVYHGRYVLFQYTYNGQDLLQLDVMYYKKPTKAAYFLEFIAPVDEFDSVSQTVKAMVETFSAP